jgi:tRNA U34 5-methylaminomethyl-2-thiouridine-forming methyltransferase MnmC
MELNVTPTRDGSLTLYHPQLNETYHSLHGAFQESVHVFIRQGLELFENHQSPLSLLEIGMGTGLNVLLTAMHPLASHLSIRYTTLEPHPLPREIVEALNYPSFFEDTSKAAGLLEKIHAPSSNQHLVSGCWLEKHVLTLQEFSTAETFQLVYFDAFAPSKQPELWEESIFRKLASLMKSGALLVTYCAQGQFRRNLRAAGFEALSLPGPPGKREMTRAIRI